MKKNIIILGFAGIGLFLGLILGLNGLSTAVPMNTEALEAANNLYIAGHYGEAARLYEQMAAQGVEDSVLFYNLGNAYYQLGDQQRAGINYIRAAQIVPRDADIAANLDLIGGAPALNSPVERALAATTLNETAVLTLTIWFIFGLLLLAYARLAPGRGRKTVGYAAGMTFVALLAAGALLGGHMMVNDLQGGLPALEAMAA